MATVLDGQAIGSISHFRRPPERPWTGEGAGTRLPFDRSATLSLRLSFLSAGENGTMVDFRTASLPAEVWPAGFSIEGLTTDPTNGRVPR